MLGLRLMRLIERHSEELALGLAEKLQFAERTNDFRKIPSAELEVAASEIYGNLGEWLLQKTEDDIEERFRAIAARRADEGVGLHQFVWALVISRNHLWQFLREQACADNIVALYGELELQQMLNQFFDRAIYYAVLEYVEGEEERAQRFSSGMPPRSTNYAIESPPSPNATTSHGRKDNYLLDFSFGFSPSSGILQSLSK
ncbi:MAG TPA: histidine kinase N-terminal domain-containing protein [Terriglobales bacterium]|nr:histidine kinase N-terminal domain-containing protein [Terriglobales bacterium]